MLFFLPPAVRGAVALTLLMINTLVWCALVLCAALLKWALPLPSVRRQVDPLLNRMASYWITCNSGWMRLTQRTAWDVEGVGALQYRNWYLVNCNHQTWVDIFVLQRVLNGRVPLLKFFLKHQLIYLPLIGMAWWALDFPFLRRNTKEDLRRHPERRLSDREATRRACEKFALVPTSVISFAEGTRFTPAKRQQQNSPYRHLLKPRAGALALTLNAMGGQFHSLLDVTIIYPAGAPTFWQFVSGHVPKIVVRMRELPIPDGFNSRDYAQDRAFRREFQHWLSGMWDFKDGQIETALAQQARPAASGHDSG